MEAKLPIPSCSQEHWSRSKEAEKWDKCSRVVEEIQKHKSGKIDAKVGRNENAFLFLNSP